MARSALLLLLLTSACAKPPSYDVQSTRRDQSDIRAVLETQVAAWNQGDKEAFMAGYLRSDSLRFASGGSVQYGWDTTLERYRRAYPDRAAMGTLTFSDLDIRMLSPEYALVFGRWHLDRVNDTPNGLFTLLFRTVDGEWFIIHDHTSSSPSE